MKEGIFMNPENLQFHRLFSKTMYKNLQLPLWEMTFSKDFITDTRGDLYPVIEKSEDCAEQVTENRYHLRAGYVSRMAGSFFPYATYKLTFLPSGGSCGFSFVLPCGLATVLWENNALTFSDGTQRQTLLYDADGQEITMLITCRPGAFDTYICKNGKPELVGTFQSAAFADSHCQQTFQQGYVALVTRKEAVISGAKAFMDCGISQADMRPVRYENGDVMVENGKVYLSATIRMETGGYQGIFSWVPGTSQFELVGALFYDSGDGRWCGDVAASILYNKDTGRWKLWVCSFSHGHILGHAEFGGDPRFGVNVVDITLMEKADANMPVTAFAGFASDEDPDFYFDEAEQKWYMAVCRIDPAIGEYRYMFFRSDHPFDGYTYIGSGLDGAETGGSFVKFRGERIFACGNDFKKRADYRIYTKDGALTPQFDFDDGGFRGWGTIIPVALGTRTRYFWLTFDRHNGSDFPWSYGNWYCFEAI